MSPKKCFILLSLVNASWLMHFFWLRQYHIFLHISCLYWALFPPPMEKCANSRGISPSPRDVLMPRVVKNYPLSYFENLRVQSISSSMEFGKISCPFPLYRLLDLKKMPNFPVLVKQTLILKKENLWTHDHEMQDLIQMLKEENPWAEFKKCASQLKTFELSCILNFPSFPFIYWFAYDPLHT